MKPTLISSVFATMLAMGTIAAPANAAPAAASAAPAQRWQSLPATPAPVAGGRRATATVNGVALSYADYGRGSPVILLHGGPANSDYFGNQVRALQGRHRVILVDTRGHGRSAMDARPMSYDLMADDVVALMDRLKIAKADIVGWSDGGITALDMAMRHPTRVKRIVAFGANTKTDGTFPDADKKPAFSQFVARAADEYKAMSPTPAGFDALNKALGDMYAQQPNWSDAQLKTIKAPVLIMDGDHDEAIRPEHTRYIAATIPGARLVFLPNTSHFSFLQDPARFNAEMIRFLDGPAAARNKRR